MKNNFGNSSEEKKVQKKHLTALVLAGMAILILLVSISRAWFVNQANITTLLTVTPPSPISIRGAHGEAMTALDLSYTDADPNVDIDEESHRVTIRRVISVYSNSERHQLEIVHTTNLKGLKFKIYPATETAGSSGSTGEDNTGKKIEESGYEYTYQQGNGLTGSYINGTGADSSDTEYGYADQSRHTQNYGNYQTVQAHAEPLYWKVAEVQSGHTNTDKEVIDRDYVSYYVLEISWTDTTKESDVFYVLAKTA